MTSLRSWPIVDAQAPALRLAAFRLLLGTFTMGYVLLRVHVYLGLHQRPRGAFEGVGALSGTSGPPSQTLMVGLLVTTLATGVAFTLGVWFRATAPVYAVGLLVLCTYRSSFGQLLHFENLFVLHVVVIALSPAADAWALHPSRGTSDRDDPSGAPASTSYGFPLALAALITVVTYLIAGIAKLRYGGAEWVLGDTLRNHVAYSATRLDLIGGDPAPLAAAGVDHDWVFRPMGFGTVLIELGAPVALFGTRLRWAWATLAWAMHLGILTFMLVGFPYPLFLVAFTPLFHLEELRHPGAGLQRLRRALGRLTLRSTRAGPELANR